MYLKSFSITARTKRRSTDDQGRTLVWRASGNFSNFLISRKIFDLLSCLYVILKPYRMSCDAHVWATKFWILLFKFRFVSYSIQALYTQRGRLPSSSVSLRSLILRQQPRHSGLSASRVLNKWTHHTTQHDKLTPLTFSSLHTLEHITYQNFQHCTFI